MEKNNDLISVIEDLLEADMTAPKKVKNPQSKMSEEEQVDEAQDKTDKAIAANKLSSTAKPSADNASDNSSEVIGSEKGAAMDAGGDKDVGKMDKGKLPSDAADNSSEVIGSEKGAAMDAGGDKDVGKMGSKEKGNPSDASAAAEPNKGPHDQAMDEDLHDGDDGSDDVVSEDDGTVEEGQDTKIVKNANDEQLPDDEKESMKNMKEEDDDDDDSDDDDSDDEESKDESVQEDLEWDWEKIDSLSEEDFNELVGSLDEAELSEFNERFESLVEAEEVNELSKKTMGSYVAKASADHGVKKMSLGINKSIPDAPKDDMSQASDFGKKSYKRKVANRSAGISKAVNKMSEDDIQELSNKTMGSYIKKAVADKGKKEYAYGKDTEMTSNKAQAGGEKAITRQKSIQRAARKMSEEMEWDWEKIEGLTEEEFNDFYTDLSEEEQSEIEEHYKEVTEDKGDMDKDGIDEPDGKEYMDNKDKAIKAAMAKKESVESDDEEVEEATGEKLEKTPTKSSNDPMRPDQEKGDNEPETKGGNPGEGPHDQSKDANETSTKANPKGAVKEEEEVSAEDQLTEDLDEDFKEKAKVIFETAVNEKASIIREEIEAQYAAVLEEEVETLNNKVNEYVDYAVNEWLEENALEIKYSLRTEIAENFIREMKTVFETNFIDIPEEEVSVVDELTEAVESYKEQLEEQATSLETANKELLEIKRKEIVDGIGEDLPQTQKIRLEKLSENVEAEDIEEFRYKIEQLKEGYFDESSEQPLLSSLSEEVFGGTVIEEDNDSSVSQYAKFLSKTVTK